MRIELTGEFTTLDVTEGTLQNVSRQVPIEIATTTTKDTGIILQPGESIQFQSDAAVYARSVEMNPEARETPYLAHVPFKGKGEGGDESNNSRKASTAYEVGDIAYLSSLSLGKKLVCVAAGTTASGGLAPASTDEGAIVTDGTVKWAIDSMADGIYNAAHHNSYYRGADITAYFESGDMSTNIAAGNFVNIFPGDYITKTVSTAATTYTDKAGNSQTQAAATYSNVKWLVAGLDVYLHCGDTETTAHHVVMIPNTTLQRNVKMNPSSDTTGAYLGSDMWTVHMPIWSTAIQNAFGSSHVLSYRDALSYSINLESASSATGRNIIGQVNGRDWATVVANIPTDQMVCCSTVFSSSGFEAGVKPYQLPLYSFCVNHLEDRSWFWLRNIAANGMFCFAKHQGNIDYMNAWGADANGGVRPYFLLK